MKAGTLGPKGNVEFLAWMGAGEAGLDVGSLIEKIV